MQGPHVFYKSGSRAVLIVSVMLFPVLLLLGDCGTAAAQDSLGPQALRQIRALMQEKASRTPEQQKVDSSLLIEAKRQSGRVLPAGLPTPRASVRLDASSRVEVDVQAEVTTRLMNAIAASRGSVVNRHERFHAIRAWIPLDQVERIAAEPDVRFIAPAAAPLVNKVNTSAGDVAHGADVARTLFGVDGTGVKVGVLSNGVASLTARQATGDLPPTVTVLPGQAGAGDEGTAMLEIVFDLAPGAQLYFATGTPDEAQMAQNILALQAAGCDVIVDDLFYSTEDTFQDDVIAQAVETVTVAGVSYFSSAGNSGDKDGGTSGTWEGDYAPASAPSVIGGSALDFGGGISSNLITADTNYFIVLQWSDPHLASANDYDLYLLDPTLSTVLAFSTNTQNGGQDPFEAIDSRNVDYTGDRLVIIRKDGTAARYLHLDTNGGTLSISTAGQTSGHAAAASAFGIAAVSATAPRGAGGVFNGSEHVERFSSDGPRRMFYSADGTPITPGNLLSTGGAVRNKPDFTAADCVATATPDFSPFCGTSAAAPHAAAIAALMINRDPIATPAMIRSWMLSTSLDIESPGWDRDSGSGILNAVTAVAQSVPAPSARYGHTAIRDPVRDRMLLFGGWSGLALNDLWALPLAVTPGWASLAATGTPPGTRYQQSAIYDVSHDRVVVVGGSGGGFLDDIDVWSLSLSPAPSWTHLAFAGTKPSERNWPVTTYDAPRDRMLMFGGSDNASYHNDVWAMSLSGSPVWTPIAPAGTAPSARYAPTAILDPVRDRLVGFGGYADGAALRDLWSLSLASAPAWTPLPATGTPPSPRYGPTAIYDPVRDRMILFGGRSNGIDLDDMWSLSLSGVPAWTNITPPGTGPGTRFKSAAVYDPARDRMLLFGGMRGSEFLGDTWVISLGSTGMWTNMSMPPLVDVVEKPPLGSELSLVMAPRGTGHELRYSLPAPGRTTLRIHDLSGRIVTTLVDGDAAAGVHRVVWSHHDRGGREVNSGVYFVQLQSGGRSARGKIVVLR